MYSTNWNQQYCSSHVFGKLLSILVTQGTFFGAPHSSNVFKHARLGALRQFQPLPTILQQFSPKLFFSHFLGYFCAPQDQFWGTQLLQRVQTGQVGCPHTSFHNNSRYFKCFDPSESTIVAAGAWCRGASVGQKCTKNHNANWRLWGQNSPWI